MALAHQCIVVRDGYLCPRFGSSEIEFLRKIKKWIKQEYVRNEDIRKELNVEELTKKIKDYRNNWYKHIQRINDTRLPKIAYHYNPKERKYGRTVTR